jgi:probable F420-dependent oxidoreductase
MELGLFIPHTGAGATASRIREFCRTAEGSGIAALWTVDHMVMPNHTDSKYLLGRNPASIADGAVSELMSPNYEMLTTLAWVAGFTETIKLGTSVAVLPIRNAISTARQLATLDVFSGGRTIFGVGAGWLREEADSMGMPWDKRGARVEEFVELLRALWCAEGDLFEFHGEFHDISPMDPEPRPVQRPIPILIGGHSDAALSRAGRLGDGWISSSMSAGRVSEHWSKVRHAAEQSGRDPDRLSLYSRISPQPDVPLVDQLSEYDAAGVTHLQMRIQASPGPAELEQVMMIGQEIAPQFAPGTGA